MKFKKPPLTFSQQAKLLIKRDLVADKDDLEDFLSKVNYYRFSGYLYPFRSENSKKLTPGTTLDFVREIYKFDSNLRLLVLSAIEIIDVAILRTRMVERFSLECGPFCYTDISNFGSDLNPNTHRKMMNVINKNVERSDKIFVKNYKSKYKKEKHLPYWMIAEISTLSQLSIMFRYLPFYIQAPIAKDLGLHSRDLVSWLHSLTVIRNICAHHSRLWNIILPVKPKQPSSKHRPEFYEPIKINNDSFFIILAILEYLQKAIYPKKSFADEFSKLLSKHPEIPLNKMGIPNNWTDYLVFR